jgi:hypothetical protein
MDKAASDLRPIGCTWDVPIEPKDGQIPLFRQAFRYMVSGHYEIHYADGSHKTVEIIRQLGIVEVENGQNRR